MLIQNAAVFLPDGRFTLSDVRFGDTITELGRFPDETGLDATGCFLVPGFIDIHTHGAMGYDFSDGDTDAMSAPARFYAAHGVTRFLAATMTLPEETLLCAARAIAAFRPAPDMARCAGVFLEGPFLSYTKRGAQAAAHLHAPDIAMFRRLDQAAAHRVRMVAVAPETEGALPFIREAAAHCAVSLAHTACTYPEATDAFEAGASILTHLFNAMPPLLHREPGPIGAGTDAIAYAELIADGLHVHPSAVRAAFRLFPNRIVLISDSLRCAGMPDGAYTLGGQQIELCGGRCTLKDTDTLAGSVITVHDAVRNAVRFGIPLETAVAAATHNPARAVHIDGETGAIRPGLAADLLLLNQNLDILRVFIGGRALAL